VREIDGDVHDGLHELRAEGAFGPHSDQVPHHEKLALRELDQLRAEEVEEDVEDREGEVGRVLEEILVEQARALLGGEGFHVSFCGGREAEILGGDGVGFEREEVVANHLDWACYYTACHDLRRA
jgi:hypothetical protein